MARFRGAIGFGQSQQTAPGVFTEVITEIMYTGDVVRSMGRLEPSATAVNNDISVDNALSVLADAYAVDNINAMRYVKWNGATWKITSVEVRRPRLILNFGGLWNGNTA